jgi:hypothetical protein
MASWTLSCTSSREVRYPSMGLVTFHSWSENDPHPILAWDERTLLNHGNAAALLNERHLSASLYRPNDGCVK